MVLEAITSLFGSDPCSKLEKTLRANAGNTMRLKVEVAAGVALISKVPDAEHKKYIECLDPYVMRLLDANVVHQESLATYVEHCERIGERRRTEQIMNRLHRIMRLEERATMDMIAAGMERRNWYNRLCKRYQIFSLQDEQRMQAAQVR